VVGATLLLLTTPAALGEPLRPAGVAEVEVEGGFWGPRLDTNATVTLPHNLEFIEKTGRMGAFDRAAGVDVAGASSPVAENRAKLGHGPGRPGHEHTASSRPGAVP
jgi:hypothetical protein